MKIRYDAEVDALYIEIRLWNRAPQSAESCRPTSRPTTARTAN